MLLKALESSDAREKEIEENKLAMQKDITGDDAAFDPEREY